MTEKTTKNVVILGASYAGLSASHYFLKHVLPTLPDSANGNYHVYLVNPSTHFYHRVASPRAAASFDLMPNSKTFYDIKAGFESYNKETFTFLQGKAVSLDTTQRTVTIERTGESQGTEETLTYHALIIATGTKTYEPTLSLQGGLHEDTIDALNKFHEKLETAKTIVVAGGGPAGVEVAGEIGEHLNGVPGWFQKRPANPKATITLYSGSDKLLPILRPALSQQAEVFLNRVGVDVVHKVKMVSTEEMPNGQTKVFFSDGKEVECDIFIPCMGAIPMTEYLPERFLDKRGYVEANPETLRIDEAGARVYAVGDVATYTRGGILDIMEAIPVLMTNVQRDLLAAHNDPSARPTGPDRKFKPNTTETQLVPVGQSKGVGAFNGNKLPVMMVYLIKGRDYMLSSAVAMVTGSKWKKENGWKPTDG